MHGDRLEGASGRFLDDDVTGGAFLDVFVEGDHQIAGHSHASRGVAGAQGVDGRRSDVGRPGREAPGAAAAYTGEVVRGGGGVLDDPVGELHVVASRDGEVSGGIDRYNRAADGDVARGDGDGFEGSAGGFLDHDVTGSLIHKLVENDHQIGARCHARRGVSGGQGIDCRRVIGYGDRLEVLTGQIRSSDLD